MLSSEANDPVTPNSESQAAAPTQRRRRAASRPAGAPSTAPAPAETPSPPSTAPEAPTAADASVAQTPPAEAAAPDAPRTRGRARAPRATASDETSASATPDAEPAADTSAAAPAEDLAPKRRRAATKPTTRSTTTRRRKVEVDADAERAPEPVERAAEQPAAAAPQEEAAEKAPTRRRASRRAAAPAQPAPATEAAPEPAEAVPAQQAETPAEAVPPHQADDPAPEPTREPAALGRGRQARALGRGAQARAIEGGTAEEATTEDIPVDAAQTPSDPEPAPQRSRRRRATRPTAAPEEPKSSTAADPDEDPIAAALRAAEELAEARRAVLSDPFITAQARDAQLAALARSIAAGVSSGQPQPTDAASDEDAADEDSEDDLETSDEISDDDPASEEDGQESEDDLDAEDDSDEDDDDSAEGERPTRRRRRRGGRRRRRGGPSSDADSDESDDSSDDDDSDDSDATEDAADEGDAADDADADSGTVRRRRRRRRRSGDTASDSSHDDEVTGIEGSTRMEAKRQRRKESRAAGRRRAPILSEAEFLARRESVDRKLVIRQSEDYTQLAVIEDDILVEHYVDKASATSLIGNIYVGKVQNVLPSMEAAFIDIGRGRNAVLYAGEVDWDSFEVSGENRKVENVLKSGQSVLVQVTKDPVGAKGARLTGHVSLPGRYIVYSPGGHLSGISRKLPDVERNRLRTILAGLISDQESVIVRTAAEGVNEEELVRDVNRLKAQWEVIEKKSKKGAAPQALYAEPDLTLRIVRDLFTEDFGKLIVQGDGGPEDTYDAISAYVSHVAPHLQERLERFDVSENGQDVFAKFKVDEQIAKALDRKVFLPSGGSLVIDRTEAMTVVDVNTGRFTGAGGNLEATVTSNNLEAAEEVVRQLRLRDIGGIIVIDFIDMVLPSNRDLLLRRLVECLSRDRTRHQVSEVTSLGLVQLTRKKIGTGLQEAFTEPCEHCNGQGYHRFEDPVDSQAPSDGGDRKGGNGRRRGGRGR